MTPPNPDSPPAPAVDPPQAPRRNVVPLYPDRGELLAIPRTAIYLNLSERNVRQIVTERRITYVKVGGKVQFYKSDLDAYLASREVPARTDAS